MEISSDVEVNGKLIKSAGSCDEVYSLRGHLMKEGVRKRIALEIDGYIYIIFVYFYIMHTYLCSNLQYC